MSKFTIGKQGLELIKHYEAFMPKPYLCPAGIPTIGYGATIYPNGDKVTLEDHPISIELAEFYLVHHCEGILKDIEEFLESLNLKQHEIDAICSFAYNLGLAPVINKERSLSAALRTKDNEKIRAAFLMYNKAGGKELAGLTKRRKCEANLYCTGLLAFG
jgi:lysozyme